MTSPLDNCHAFPLYDEPATYVTVGDRLRQWEHSGWKAESLSWKTSCYIHTGLSGPVLRIAGPDADAFVSWLCTNSLSKFAEGSMRHAVMCNEKGLIASHGILQRYEDGHYLHFAAGPWPYYMALQGKFVVDVQWIDMFVHQVAGPRSREALERVTGEDLGDIAFLRYRRAVIAGRSVEIGRIGMSGNLAYEVRGSIEDGAPVYDAIYQANRDIGIERLGWRTYLVNHVEGGFPQSTWTFGLAMVHDADFQNWIGKGHFALHPQRTGSYEPCLSRPRLRNPYEVNWDGAVRFNHDFIGREALEKAQDEPKRRTVTLRWNAEDVIDIFASLYRPGEEYKTMDLPTTPPWSHGMVEHADRVLADGRLVGVSSGSIYSYWFRENLSLGCIDEELTEPGTELVVEWGDHGKRIKDVRVTVDRFPYLDDVRNSENGGQA